MRPHNSLVGDSGAPPDSWRGGLWFSGQRRLLQEDLKEAGSFCHASAPLRNTYRQTDKHPNPNEIKHGKMQTAASAEICPSGDHW